MSRRFSDYFGPRDRILVEREFAPGDRVAVEPASVRPGFKGRIVAIERNSGTVQYIVAPENVSDPAYWALNGEITRLV